MHPSSAPATGTLPALTAVIDPKLSRPRRGSTPAPWFASSAVLLSLTFLMAVRLRHARLPSFADQHVALWLQSPRVGRLLVDFELTAMWTKPGLQSLAALGGPSMLIVVIASVLGWSWRRRDVVLGLLAVIGPVAAGAITEWVGKPLVDRRIDGIHPSFPSGHVTTAAAIAALLWITAQRGAGHRIRAMAVGVWGIPIVVSVAVIQLRWHVATDAIAGIGVGSGVVFGLLGALTVAGELLSRVRAKRHPDPENCL